MRCPKLPVPISPIDGVVEIGDHSRAGFGVSAGSELGPYVMTIASGEAVAETNSS